LSKGRASYSMEPDKFEQVPTSIVNTLLDSIMPVAARS
jgi:translation elongation factor EF-G